jgi:hypothetical protein
VTRWTSFASRLLHFIVQLTMPVNWPYTIVDTILNTRQLYTHCCAATSITSRCFPSYFERRRSRKPEAPKGPCAPRAGARSTSTRRPTTCSSLTTSTPSSSSTTDAPLLRHRTPERKPLHPQPSRAHPHPSTAPYPAQATPSSTQIPDPRLQFQPQTWQAHTAERTPPSLPPAQTCRKTTTLVHSSRLRAL